MFILTDSLTLQTLYRLTCFVRTWIQ